MNISAHGSNPSLNMYSAVLTLGPKNEQKMLTVTELVERKEKNLLTVSGVRTCATTLDNGVT